MMDYIPDYIHFDFYKEINKKLSGSQVGVLSFINEFFRHSVRGQNSANIEEYYEALRVHYRSGYCWHFAHILRDTFERGEVCWAAPMGHFVWKDTDSSIYDAEGFYEGEAIYFIPENYLSKDELLNFKHMSNNKGAATTRERLIEIIKKYCSDTNTEYDYKSINFYLPFHGILN